MAMEWSKTTSCFNQWPSAVGMVRRKGQTSGTIQHSVQPTVWGYSSYPDYLEHHGVPGQKKGVRRYVNEDGSWTPEGYARYRSLHPTEYGKGGTNNTPSGTQARGQVRTTATQPRNRQMTNQQPSRVNPKARNADKKARTRKLLMIAGGVTVAAIAGYALHKHLGNVANQRQKDIMDMLDKMQMPTTSKDWSAEEKLEYKNMLSRQAKERASEVTRGSILKEKLGLTSREDVLKERRRGMEVGNFYRKANNRAEVNRRIADARKDLEGMRESVNRPGLNEGLRNKYRNSILDQEKLIEELLEKKKRLAG